EGEEKERPGQRADASAGGAEPIEHRRSRGGSLEVDAEGDRQAGKQSRDGTERQGNLPRGGPLLLVLAGDRPIGTASHGGDKSCDENGGDDRKQPDPQLPGCLTAEDGQ